MSEEEIKCAWKSLEGCLCPEAEQQLQTAKEENEKLKEFLYFNFCENRYEPDKLIIEAGRALEMFKLQEWRNASLKGGE